MVTTKDGDAVQDHHSLQSAEDVASQALCGLAKGKRCIRTSLSAESQPTSKDSPKSNSEWNDRAILPSETYWQWFKSSNNPELNLDLALLFSADQ